MKKVVVITINKVKKRMRKGKKKMRKMIQTRTQRGIRTQQGASSSKAECMWP